MLLSRNYIQRTVLRLGHAPFWARLWHAYYDLGLRAFVGFTRGLNGLPGQPVKAIYLRRGGGRSELVPGASDLDFFLVLNACDAQSEMTFLKEFWRGFRKWQRLFPFLGETLMGDEHELALWARTPTVRGFEAPYSWKLLWGEAVEWNMIGHPIPDPRDVLAEATKCYWAMLKAVLHVPSLRPGSGDFSNLAFRHFAKGAIDLFRMHRSFGAACPEAEREELWRANRAEAASLLSPIYGDLLRLVPWLQLRDPWPAESELWEILVTHLYHAFLRLNELAARIPTEEGELEALVPLASAEPGDRADRYADAVRDLFAERMLLRHRGLLRRALISAQTTHILFLLDDQLSRAEFAAVLADLREACRSFHLSSVAVPLGETAHAQLARTTFLDSPFHAFHEHFEIVPSEGGGVSTKKFRPVAVDIPRDSLRKAFAELSLALRFQPPPDLRYVVEGLLSLVMQLRLAAERGEVPTDFAASLAGYDAAYPERAAYLRDQLGPYLPRVRPEEDEFWAATRAALERLGQRRAGRAAYLRARMEILRSSRGGAEAATTTGLWIELAPFLRLEMNAMRERFFPALGPLKM